VLAVAALPAGAATVISRSGTPSGFYLASPTPNPAYVSWNQPAGTAFSNVSVSVTLSSSDGNAASGTAYITNAVGLGATNANVIAGPIAVGTSSVSPVSVPISFPAFNLAQGATYFLVIQEGSGNLQWNFANPATETVSSTPAVTSNADGVSAASASPAYTATFSAAGSPAKGLLFSVTGDPATDISVTKTGPPTANAGTNIVYTVTVTNNSATAAAGVSVADVTPANLTFVSNTGGCTGAYPCSIGSIAGGVSVVITSTYTIAPAFTGSVSNTTTVSSTTIDLNPGNNSSTATTNVGASADLSITKTAAGTVLPGGNITYTITVNNAGPSTATGTTVSDVLPGGVTFVSATPSQGTCSGTTTVSCPLGTVNPAGSATITLVVRNNASTGTSVSNTASVTSAAGDTAASNNTSTASVTVSAPTVPTLSTVGMGLLLLLLTGLGVVLQRRGSTV